jgi:hypothetical protein
VKSTVDEADRVADEFGRDDQAQDGHDDHVVREDQIGDALLPGLLATTRTGLPPAGDDELTNTKNTMALRHGVTSHFAGRTKRLIGQATQA